MASFSIEEHRKSFKYVSDIIFFCMHVIEFIVIIDGCKADLKSEIMRCASSEESWLENGTEHDKNTELELDRKCYQLLQLYRHEVLSIMLSCPI